MRALSVFLMIVVLLSGTTVLAQQPEKVRVCHYPPDNPGNVQVIEISVNALPDHQAHGDDVIGVDVDENCQPISFAQTGCFHLSSYLHCISSSFGHLYCTTLHFYVQADGSDVQPLGSIPRYSDPICMTQSVLYPLWDNSHYVVWAADADAAQVVCNAIPGTNGVYTESPVPHLYACY